MTPYCTKPVLSERLRITGLNNMHPIWLQHKYRTDSFYQYALADHPISIDLGPKKSFNIICHHRTHLDFVGFATGYIAKDKNALWIQSFLIDRKYLRQGYGSEFYMALISLFKNHLTLKKVYLSCYESNNVGILFWESLHFVKTLELETNKQKTVIYEQSIDTDMRSNYESQDIENT